jgi:hypothetical protein
MGFHLWKIIIHNDFEIVAWSKSLLYTRGLLKRGLSLKRVLDMKVCKRGHNSKGMGLSYEATFVSSGKVSQKYIIRSEVIF